MVKESTRAGAGNGGGDGSVRDGTGDSSAPAPPKPNYRFVPKVPARKKKAEPSTEKTEIPEMVGDEKSVAMLKAMVEGSTGRRGLKPESKAAQDQLTCGQGGPSSARSFGFKPKPKGRKGEDSEASEYIEPWDWEATKYPITLPWRQPYAGDPEILDEDEFGEDAKSKPLDEDSTNSARELGLLDPSEEPQMIHFKFPDALPLEKIKEWTAGAATNARNNTAHKRPEGCQLKDLPAGRMGKLLVYKSGKVKLKLGDVLFEVNSGEKTKFAQDVAVMNAAKKHCCIVGNVKECAAVVTPDIDSL